MERIGRIFETTFSLNKFKLENMRSLTLGLLRLLIS
jgi:hypothetical protein